MKIWVVYLICVFLVGCYDSDRYCEENANNDDFYCPACDGIVSWCSYEWIFLDKFGDDSCGWKLVSDCGWKIYQGHEGGWGDTLEVVSCEGGVVFIWAWNHFSGFRLTKGWTGTTIDGIKIGSSLDEFLSVYPDFVLYEYLQDYYNQICYEREFVYTNRLEDDGIYAYFDENNKLEKLTLYRSGLDNDKNVTAYENIGCFLNCLEDK